MCGRFAITSPPEALRRLFGYEAQPNFPPRYNIAPTQPIPIVHSEATGEATGAPTVRRVFRLARWAFLPGFVKDPKGFPVLFNARSEGITDKASFRNAIRRRRCLVPADAFYEWRRLGGPKSPTQPYMARRLDGTPMALAGIWETWMGPNGEEVDTAAILTTSANGVSAAIHPRLPAIVAPSDFTVWLDPDETATDAALRLLRPVEDDVLVFTPVGDAVNKVANDGPEVMAPVGTSLTSISEPDRPTRPIDVQLRLL